MFRFERLDVWRKSYEFSGLVYQATARFPESERFGLTSQLRRAGASISGNIAEGSSRTSDKDFSRFIEMAYGSLCEVVSHSHIATREGFMSSEQRQSTYKAAEELGKMLSAFRSSLGNWKSLPESHG